jgi:hypothetical protein
MNKDNIRKELVDKIANFGQKGLQPKVKPEQEPILQTVVQKESTRVRKKVLQHA